jgi:hypothetical protein
MQGDVVPASCRPLLAGPEGPAVSAIHGCPFGPSRAEPLRGTSLIEVMDGHVPSWLPEGMGCALAFGEGWDGIVGGAYLSDANCREVTMWYAQTNERPTEGERFGDWYVVESAPNDRGNAVLGGASCLNYTAPVDGGIVALNMMGLERDECDRISDSIPL